MHAALIVPAPFDAVTGGYEYDRRIVAGLSEAGHDVRVVELAGTHPVADATAREAARVAWHSMTAEWRPIIDGLALPAFAGLDDALAVRGAVGLIHHPTSMESGLSEAGRASLLAAEKRLLPWLARIVVTSEPTSDSLVADFGVSRDRIRVVVPGTDDAPRSAGSGGPTCRILSIGTLVPRKGHDLLLRALARLFDLDWHLTIVGSPERDPVHAQALAQLAEELGLAKRVRFAGVVTGGALEALWEETDVFALATSWEGYGMAIAEALKRGVPVAVTDGGAAGHLVTPEAGVVCPARDQTNLSKALRRVIFGKDLRRSMAEAAWQIGQTLPGWHAQVREFIQALAD
ncbi:MAG TPA: glycosyltransferase family 4 protein [Rhodanobacteraceae bacterium]|nr:glycosyltransferase family 4 protein [Rhodanobacteraceae bacterium]